ncbi:hypothetical protein [Nocardia niigatensis]|nr:hypothetical protein [Nocardia niigatensis]
MATARPVALIAAALTRLASTPGSGVTEIDRERYRFDSFCATVHSGEPG